MTKEIKGVFYMKNTNDLLDELLEIGESCHKTFVEVDPKFGPLMVMMKALSSSDRSEEMLIDQIEDLKNNLELHQLELDKSREFRLNLLQCADNEIRRIGVNEVSQWVEDKKEEIE